VIEDSSGFFAPTEHSGAGFLVAAGPSFRSALDGPVPREVDIAPTVLHLMGCPVPELYEGVVLERILRPREPVVRGPIALAIDPFARRPGAPASPAAAARD
jgi:hypothetical protein